MSKKCIVVFHTSCAVQAGTELPEAKYPILDSLEKPVSKKKISSLQLEGVIYAAQSHLRFLPDGTRAGFYIGDSAGER